MASESPRRKEILELMGLSFCVIPSHCEEIITETEPSKIVMELSRQKAADVAKMACFGDLIIGSDTIVALDHQILGKPHSREEAFQMISSMQGRTHQVYTGVTLIQCADPEKGTAYKEDTFFEQTEVFVAEMAPEEINAYLDMDEYGDKAGSYGIQGHFAPHIRGINGDYYNVMGLPAAALYRHLKSF